jgi:cytidylate kinase
LKRIIIAIDGHSSCGKGTLARQLALALGYKFIDSGAMYRAITLHLLNTGINPDDEQAVASVLPNITIDFSANTETGRSDIWLNHKNVEKQIRTLKVAESAVRRYLVAMQQKMGEEKGVVMDGRDIGTVVFPSAELKIFMTASPEVRAMRRFKELSDSGLVTSYDDVFANLKQRDLIDSNRKDSPLTMTGDYKLLDNSAISKQEQFEIAMNWAKTVIQSANSI